jgi:hypothetical protein
MPARNGTGIRVWVVTAGYQQRCSTSSEAGSVSTRQPTTGKRVSGSAGPSTPCAGRPRSRHDRWVALKSRLMFLLCSTNMSSVRPHQLSALRTSLQPPQPAAPTRDASRLRVSRPGDRYEARDPEPAHRTWAADPDDLTGVEQVGI